MNEPNPFSGSILTVDGPIAPEAMGFTLPHEHVMSTFGSDLARYPEYPSGRVLEIVLPYLAKIRSLGCRALLDCTAAYFGRHPELLQRISRESGLHIVTNTGYYAAAGDRYVPPHAFAESAEEIANRWEHEFSDGIDETGIRPGFIKTAVDDGPLSEIDRKLVLAAILAHKRTGMTIQTHTGNNPAAVQEILSMLAAEGVHPSAWVWVHAHSLPDPDPLVEAARLGAWISLDGVNPASAAHILGLL